MGVFGRVTPSQTPQFPLTWVTHTWFVLFGKKGDDMATLEGEFSYLRAAIGLLDGYLLANDLYWPVGIKAPVGSPPYPQLTLGNMLLSLKRLKAHPLSVEQQAELTELEQELYRLQTKWRVAWEEKAAREFSARSKLWRDFLEEYRSSPENHADRYPYEINRRVLLELLAPQTSKIMRAELEMLAGLDKLLNAYFIPGSFVWDEELAIGFPPQPFWYLYGRMKTE
jgi:hypothetical protein